MLFAGAAIGVSHLILSTKAGAAFGFGLVWVVLLAHLMKYPFFEFGTRYAAGTGETLLEGYKKLGNWAVGAVIIMTVGTMFTIQAAVTIVTAGLASILFGISLNPVLWSIIILFVCMLILTIGKYHLLDSLMKYIILILSISTIAAVIIAFGKPVEKQAAYLTEFEWSKEGVLFLIALMGWMPAPIDLSIWSSIWIKEKEKQAGRLTLKESLFDFNVGYFGTILLALCFLALGAMIVYGTGESLPEQGSAFAERLIQIYTASLGEWAYWIIAIAAFATMFSTTITCLDAFPRVMGRIILLFIKKSEAQGNIAGLKKEKFARLNYWFWIIIVAAGAVILLAFLGGHMGLMITIATVLSFLTAPLFAFINYRLVTSCYMPENTRPKIWLKALSWLGMIFLTGFTVCFLYFWAK